MKVRVAGLLNLLVGYLIVLVLAGCGFSEREFVLNTIPQRPDLSGWPDRLHQRIENAELQALSGKSPVDSLVDLSRLYHANGFYEEAGLCYQGLMALEPNNPKWPHLLAELLSSYGQLDESLPFRQKAMELAPDYLPALVRLGDGLFKKNHFEDAELAYASALNIDANNAYALVGLARVDMVRGDLAMAQQKLELAAAKSDFRIGADLLATVFQNRGNEQKASALRGIRKSSGSFSDIPDPWLLDLISESFDTYQLALAAGMTDRGGDTIAGIRLLKRAIQMAPRDGALHFQLGLMYLSTGEQLLARNSFSDCTAVEPAFSDGWFQLAKLLESTGDPEGQTRTLAEGLFHNPDSPGLHLANGDRLKKLRDYGGAIKEIELAISLRPEEADPYVELASLYMLQSEVERGVALLQRALELESLHPLALSTLTFYSISEGLEGDARSYFQKARQQPRLSEKEILNLEIEFEKKFGSKP